MRGWLRRLDRRLAPLPLARAEAVRLPVATGLVERELAGRIRQRLGEEESG